MSFLSDSVSLHNEILIKSGFLLDAKDFFGNFVACRNFLRRFAPQFHAALLAYAEQEKIAAVNEEQWSRIKDIIADELRLYPYTVEHVWHAASALIIALIELTTADENGNRHIILSRLSGEFDKVFQDRYYV